MGTSFKDQIQKDIDSVFLNSDEFSDIHTVNGKSMTIQIDENEVMDRQIRFNQNTDVYKKQKLIYVSEQQFGPLPSIGSLFKLDGKIYRVVDAASEYGIHSITIEANL